MVLLEIEREKKEQTSYKPWCRQEGDEEEEGK